MERKKALITGASRGIGRACANLLAQNGYDLYLICKQNEPMLEEIKQMLWQAHGTRCVNFVCDVGNQVQVCNMFREIECIDVLINNAGIAHMGLLSEMTFEQWQCVMDTNLNSVFYTCKEAVPGMVRRQSGKIINISSIWGETGASMEVAYSTAKAGVNGFTKALARELAPSNIQVNAVAFGLIDTDMNHCLSQEDTEALYEVIPAGRVGTPSEAAHMVLQVINSPAYLTGQIITMDGGWK